jgi:flagellar biosynthesis protein FlhA
VKLGDTLGAAGLVGVLALTIVPLPAVLLDLLLGVSLCLTVIVFLVTLSVEKPLQFSSFPSLLLLLTLLRLALNIASTRRILLHGGSGVEAAGGIIRAFGEFAVGGNFVVGAVVFLILVVVNFIVITKGADRIGEVAARFTLDSMPGKQMSIDADLGAGLITDVEARARRKEISEEADFHGAMDGAAKFVRGDAVAGLLIVAINIVGGMVVGVAQQGLSFADAAKTYTTLSIGDGLVSQLPALLISTGAALLTTRGSQSATLGRSLGAQLFGDRQPTLLAAGVIGLLALIPGMPHLALLALAGGVALFARRGGAPAPARAAIAGGGAIALPAPAEARLADPAAQRADIEKLMPVELLSLEVGLDLLPLIDAERNGELLVRIAGLRKQLALDLGLIVPPIHVKDDLRLRPGMYRVSISGTKVAQGEIRVGRLLAIDPTGLALSAIAGDAVREPTYGLPAKWIFPADRAAAEAVGATVVDPSSVVATHLSEIARKHAHELLGRREAQELLDLAGKTHGKLIEELIPHILPVGEVIKVLRNLLAEGVSIRDLRTILETLADAAPQQRDPAELTEIVRQRLARQITAAQTDAAGEVRALVLDPRAEELVRQGGRGADPQALSRLTSAIEEAARRAVERDEPPLLVVAPDVRRAVAAIAQRYAPGLTVLSYRELDPAVPFITRGVVSTTPAAPQVPRGEVP